MPMKPLSKSQKAVISAITRELKKGQNNSKLTYVPLTQVASVLDELKTRGHNPSTATFAFVSVADFLAERKQKELLLKTLKTCKVAAGMCYDPTEDRADPIMQSIGRAIKQANAVIAKVEGTK